MMRQILWPVAIVAALLSITGRTSATAGAATPAIEIRAFPLQGQIQDLEPYVLDFRYAPVRRQTCIGLPDDPHKSIVGSDGGLYYDYGGGRFYDFATRILARTETADAAGPVEQRLYDPRIPIVITEQQVGNLILHQEAWAGAPREESLDQWSARRVDYLWLTAKNKGDAPTAGTIVVQVDSEEPLQLGDDRRTLVHRNDPSKAFCTLSRPCAPIEVTRQATSRIETTSAAAPIRNWANPTTECHERFRHILVGWNGPLEFTYPAEPNETYRIVFGLIEGYHEQGAIRPLELRVEGRVVDSIDLVAEHGCNVPVVLGFEAQDRDGEGRLEMGVYSPTDANDTNTILSGLWVLADANVPTDADILAGRADAQALGVLDIDRVAEQNQPVKLQFPIEPLQPGGEDSILLTFLRGEKASPLTNDDPIVQRQRAIEYWRKVDLPYDRIRVPDPAVQGLIDSCIRNIYQAREVKQGSPAFQVGPTCYRGTWAADGPFILEAITYLGRASETRAGLEQQVDKDQGPGGVAFSKKSGLRLWMIWRHAQLTGDWEWLDTMWPRVRREVDQIMEYRRMTRKDPSQANYGLMPIGFGDGGLGGKHREYTNVYWTLAGLKAAIQMAQKMNKPQRLAWQAEYRDYRRVFDRARWRDKLTDSTGNVYVPVTMKGEQPQLPQRGAWAFMHSVFPGRIFEPDDELMLGTMAMLDATAQEGLIYGTGWLPEGIWNYAASFYGHAHLWLAHGRKAAATLYAFANHASPLLCWREEQNVVGRNEQYCGDMPHNWASAEFIRLVRHLLILERSDELHLLEGLPETWSKPGCSLSLIEVPTSFGAITVHMRTNEDTATLTIDAPRREPPAKIVVHTEHLDPRIVNVRIAPGPLTKDGIEVTRR